MNATAIMARLTALCAAECGKSDHDQIGANDGDVLKSESQKLRQRWYLVQRVYQLCRPFWAAAFLPFGPHLRSSDYRVTEDIKCTP
jgi:hypothetical protein